MENVYRLCVTRHHRGGADSCSLWLFVASRRSAQRKQLGRVQRQAQHDDVSHHREARRRKPHRGGDRRGASPSAPRSRQSWTRSGSSQPRGGVERPLRGLAGVRRRRAARPARAGARRLIASTSSANLVMKLGPTPRIATGSARRRAGAARSRPASVVGDGEGGFAGGGAQAPRFQLLEERARRRRRARAAGPPRPLARPAPGPRSSPGPAASSARSQTSQQRPSGGPASRSPKWSRMLRRRQRSE